MTVRPANTNEMSRNASEAAAGSGEFASYVTGVASTAATTAQDVTSTRTAVDEVSGLAADLRTALTPFTY
jgi:methyl-accepting chemotaxis protein